MHYVKRTKAKEAFSVTKYMYCAGYKFFEQSPVFEDNCIIFSIEYKAVSKYCLCLHRSSLHFWMKIHYKNYCSSDFNIPLFDVTEMSCANEYIN